MVLWKVLDAPKLSSDTKIPQLLIKSMFNPVSYVVHLTDLSNTWTEHLNLDDIVKRAFQLQSPIEVSKQDRIQLGILLDNVMKSLNESDETSCRITYNGQNNISLHTTFRLPDPLGSMIWRFDLKKTDAVTLKNEFILPLLVSCHIQHQQTSRLTSIITDKDKAINRLLCQQELNGLDLAAAFPTNSGSRSGKRMIKREEVVKHVAALQPFDEASWREDTENMKDTHIITLETFQSALVQMSSKAPSDLESENDDDNWWTVLPFGLSSAEDFAPKSGNEVIQADLREKTFNSTEEETEDEFEGDEGSRTEITGTIRIKPASLAHSLTLVQGDKIKSWDVKDGEDLGIFTGRDIHIQTPEASLNDEDGPLLRHTSSQTEARTIQASTLQEKTSRIGVKPDKAVPQSSLPSPDHGHVLIRASSSADDGADFPSTQGDALNKPNLQKSKTLFKIGGKNKKSGDTKVTQLQGTSLQTSDTETTSRYPNVVPMVSSPAHLIETGSIAMPEHEETLDEKALRRRAELKRKNDEAARKQAQKKKLKRF